MNLLTRSPLAPPLDSRPSGRRLQIPLLAGLLLATLLLSSRPGRAQGWEASRCALLPDTSFALVEIGPRGEKIRHCPHHDGAGRLDYNQLIYVLATFDQEKWLAQENREKAWKHLRHHYESFHDQLLKKGLAQPVNLNRAKLSELVALPRIGPVLAVRIVAYRQRHQGFSDIAEIRKVDGIGAATFSAIRHYLSIR